MDAEQIPTYHLIKDVIMELLTWQWKGNKEAHTLSSYMYKALTTHDPIYSSCQPWALGHADPIQAPGKGWVIYPRTPSS